MAAKQTCEVGLTLVPLALGPYNDVVIDFQKIQKSGCSAGVVSNSVARLVFTLFGILRTE
jgi:hypothetical protein